MKAFDADTSHQWEKSLPKYNSSEIPLNLNLFIDKAFENFKTGSIHKTRWLLWVGLQHDFKETDESFTEEEIGKYFDTLSKMNKAFL